MSKKNREKRKQNITTPQMMDHIRETLRTQFDCTDNEIELVTEGLQHRVPQLVADHMIAAREGKVSLPEDRGSLLLVMENGETQKITLTNHPIVLLSHFLYETYGRKFGPIYWSALTASNTKDFIEVLDLLAKNPLTKNNDGSEAE
jgi:hypothetical protein